MRRPLIFLTGILYLAAIGTARAVVVATGDGTQNTTAPSDDFGFANVGRVYNTADGFYNSGVYLGNGWVLTAYHVVRNTSLTGFQFNDVVFHDPVLGDVTFAVNPATAVRLQNSDSSFTDLALFQLTTAPTFLSAIPIATSLPSNGSTVTMAGNGVNRQSGLTSWNVNGSNVWTETTPPGTFSGYKETQGSQTLRWGTNTIDSQNTTVSLTIGTSTVNVTAFTTDFDNTTDQAQAAAGDSGGGVFYKNGSTWELAGIIDATAAFTNQPDFTAVFGDETFSASLPTYEAQIAAIIPEPGSLSLGVVGLASLVGFWRKRKG